MSNTTDTSPALRRREGDCIYFGEYPQRLKSAEVAVTGERDGSGYYLGSDGRRYARVVATPKGEGYLFTDGTPVVAGEEYYFLVEELRWRVLTEEEGTLLLSSEYIIANMAYQSACQGDRCAPAVVAGEGVYANNYKYSEVRGWLLDTFLSAAFSQEELDMIAVTEVDNGHDTVAIAPNRYICENTEDKVFLLSYADLTSEDYGLPSGKLGAKQVSDYARATGAFASMTGVSAGTGFWWTRTPKNDSGAHALSVTNNATYSKTMASVHTANIGIAPSLRIKLRG